MFPEGTNTYVGIVVAFLGTILGFFGWHIVPGMSEQIGTDVGVGLQILGGIYAFYGRMRAKTPGYFAKDVPAIASPAA